MKIKNLSRRKFLKGMGVGAAGVTSYGFFSRIPAKLQENETKKEKTTSLIEEGNLSLNTKELHLKLLKSTHTIVSLSPENLDFTFVPTDRLDERLQNKYYHLGDFRIRLKYSGNEWKEFSSAEHQIVHKKGAKRGNKVVTDFSSLFEQEFPITFKRIWSGDNQYLCLRFVLINNGTRNLEIGAFGTAMAFNNILTDYTLDDSHEKGVFVDPYIGGDFGYVQVTRLNGSGPVLIIIPEDNTNFEAYPQLKDEPTKRWVAFEGFYEWMVHSKAYTENEWNLAEQWNPATSKILKAGDSVSYGFKLLLAPAIDKIESTLIAQGHPVAVGIPGYIAEMDEAFRLILKTKMTIKDITITPNDSMDVKPTGRFLKSNGKEFEVIGLKEGRSRLTITYNNSKQQHIHYYVIPSHEQQINKLAQFHERYQWYTNPLDKFGRTFSYISYDRANHSKILNEYRVYISGLSDEPGAGPNLLMAMKNLMNPEYEQVQHLEKYANETLWGKLQYQDNFGIRASLFYGPKPYYLWDEDRTRTTWRAYNYPHQAAIYWVLYRLARNYRGLIQKRSWEWYLDKAYKTGLAMKEHCGKDDFLFLSQYGLMVGSVYLEILKDLQRESWQAEANEFESYMRSRAEIWRSLKFPYGSEMPWDSTGQEEVYTWCKYFGYEEKAKTTINAILGYMPTIPNWAYNGAARRYWDPKTYGRMDEWIRNVQHYGSSLNAIPILHAFRENPDDLYLLRIAFGGIFGVLTNIDDVGHGSMSFIPDPVLMKHDPYSSDFGQAFYGYAYNSGSYLLKHPEYGWIVFGGKIKKDGDTIVLIPTDAFRKRVFLASVGLFAFLESGAFRSVRIYNNFKKISFEFEPSDNYTKVARLVIESNVKKLKIEYIPSSEKFRLNRGAFEISLETEPRKISIEAKKKYK